ncbi:MAG: ATP phosphoribosyltransferase regulatory subunit [Solobacterium sp.]|nr:ATP phosphoribosyltransferase regulatory subunit [Solobacterium sp.]
MKQIQLPSGMHDTILEDCMKKKELQKRTEAVYRSYGYLPIDTPLIEFYSTYANVFSSLKEEELYKFVDQDGMLLALRTDMTLPIARVCATKFANSEPPFRFCYCSTVYKVRQSFAGKRNEVTDCGVELIGMDETSDPEVLTCAMDVMEAIGIFPYTLEIGNVEFIKKACEEAGLTAEEGHRCADLIDRKSLVELKNFLNTLDLSAEEREFFLRLPLCSGQGALQDAEAVCFAPSLTAIIRKMEALEAVLNALGYEGKFQFDLGKAPRLDYYTGIIFEGFVNNVGTGVLSGGRYDALFDKLARPMPACGFGVKLDYLLDACSCEPVTVTTVRYPKEKLLEAGKLAQELRKKGPVQMICADVSDVEVSV